MEQLQPIELQRAERIEANNRALLALGLKDAVTAFNASIKHTDRADTEATVQKPATKRPCSVQQSDRVLRSGTHNQFATMASSGQDHAVKLAREARGIYVNWDEARLKNVCATLISAGVCPGDLNAGIYSKADFLAMGLVIGDAAKLVAGTQTDQG